MLKLQTHSGFHDLFLKYYYVVAILEMYGVSWHNFEGNLVWTILFKFNFILFSGFEEYFKIFYQSGDLVSILDDEQGHQTQFWKRTIQAVSRKMTGAKGWQKLIWALQ